MFLRGKYFYFQWATKVEHRYPPLCFLAPGRGVSSLQTWPKIWCSTVSVWAHSHRKRIRSCCIVEHSEEIHLLNSKGMPTRGRCELVLQTELRSLPPVPCWKPGVGASPARTCLSGRPDGGTPHPPAAHCTGSRPSPASCSQTNWCLSVLPSSSCLWCQIRNVTGTLAIDVSPTHLFPFGKNGNSLRKNNQTWRRF